ncbi:MAG TPA: 4-hydroxybenzoate octaprenyltransferase, partial [Thermohalobaculum sp.]|nr:4-hydroxybenzoate octaprenyltransferase [Thermohalobaculum sp.]
RSTALLFGAETPQWLWLFTGIAVIFAALAALFAGAGWLGLIGALAFGGFMAWQTRELEVDDPEQCLALFRATRWGGLIFLGFLLADAIV